MGDFLAILYIGIVKEKFVLVIKTGQENNLKDKLILHSVKAHKTC
jgi:hypothetical protein